MWYEVGCASAFAVLAASVLPLGRIRSKILGLCSFVIHGTVVSAVGLAAGAFFRPEAVPHTAAKLVTQQWSQWEHLLPPQLAAHSELMWVALAAIVVVASMPILCTIDLYRRLCLHKTAPKKERPSKVRSKVDDAKPVVQSNASEVHVSGGVPEESRFHREHGSKPRHRPIIELIQ